MSASIVVIDGSEGEGGGQVLRTSLALSAVTGQAVRVERIRAKRGNPGLRQQHLTAVRAVAEVCGGKVDGAELGSDRVTLYPGQPRAGEYRFAVGTAGSASLVLQAVLPPLLMVGGPSRLELEGGTHNMSAPPFEFLDHVFFESLRRMGVVVSAALERPGFYPKGGGRFRVEVDPPDQLSPIDRLERGAPMAVSARAMIANLPDHIAKRELGVVRGELGWPETACEIVRRDDARGPGNALLLTLDFEHARELVTSFGRRGVRAEKVAAEAVAEARGYLRSNVPVGAHLADQLLIPMALAGGGVFRTLPLTSHSLTNMRVIERFLPVCFKVVEEPSGAAHVSF